MRAFIVNMENRPGTLADLGTALGDRGINISGLAGVSWDNAGSIAIVTNDDAATVALAAECLRQGQRAFVGRVAMDHPTGTPPWYRDKHAFAGIDSSARSIEAIRALDCGRDLVRPIITPRFTPACSDELLAGFGEAGKDVLYGGKGKDKCDGGAFYRDEGGDQKGIVPIPDGVKDTGKSCEQEKMIP